MSYLVEDLIASAKLRSFAPTSQYTFETADFIRIANEELSQKLVPDIFGKREDFFLTFKDVDLTSGVDRVTIPKRAIGNTFKSLWYVEDGVIKYQLKLATEEEYESYSGSTGTPQMFIIEGDEVVLLPTPNSSSGSVRFRYYAKPNLLISTSSCAKITAISSASGTTTFTIDTDLTADLSTGDEVDVVSGASPFLLWADEVPLTAISSTEMEVDTDDVDNAAGTVEPQVSDYICPTGYSNIPMIPVEFHAVLAQMMAVRMLAGLGDLNKLTAAAQILEQMRKESVSMIVNRVESQPRLIRPQRNGLLRTFSRF